MTPISSFGASLLVATVLGCSAYADAAPPVIAVSGNGELRIPATHVEFTVRVARNASTPAAASAECARASIAVTKSLLAVGLANGDILASRPTVGPHLEGDSSHRRRAGYEAFNTLHIDTQLIDQVGVVIDAALQAGATSVNDVEFGLLDSDTPRQTAIAKAVASARRDAETLAHAAGGTLGALVSLGTEFDSGEAAGEGARGSFVNSPLMDLPAVAGPPGIPVVAGNIVVTAHVSARWLFLPPAQ